MPSLHEQQALFYTAMQSNTFGESAQQCVLGDAAHVASRLAVYRRNMLGTLTTALTASYPVLERIVGSAFFRAAAHAYIQECPSQSGDLNDYGGKFAEFLTHWPHARELGYLPDVARLEWRVQTVYYAEDAVVDFSALAACDPAHYGHLCFVPNAAMQRMDSNWPLDAIWRVNADNYDGDMAVDFSQSARLAISRRGGVVFVDPLDSATAAFVDALVDGQNLADASALASALEPAFDLGATLTQCIQQGYFVQAFLPALASSMTKIE